MKITITKDGAIHFKGDFWELIFSGTHYFYGFGFIRFECFPKTAFWAVGEPDPDDIPF